jgi:heat-inducible transcriptional repressor
MSEPTLSKRARAVLYAVVTEFIASGEPVASRTLAKKYSLDLSAATIRNVLADLEDAGYLSQPHTSAGRVPTEVAVRLFIDAWIRVRQPSPDDAGRINDLFDELPPGADLLRETGKLLSDLTGAAAVLVRARGESRTVVKMRFIPLRPGEMLSVIVLSDGSVENRFIRTDRQLAEGELERLHNMLEEAVEGRTLAAVRDYFKRGLKERRDELAQLHEIGLSLASAALDQAEHATDIVIEGQARLFEMSEFQDGERMKDLLLALEDRERLVQLLDRTVGANNVQVFLGEEMRRAVGYPVSVVAAPYHGEDGRPGGAVGVIGPARMDYPVVVPLVGATAEAMTAALQRSRDGSGRMK